MLKSPCWGGSRKPWALVLCFHIETGSLHLCLLQRLGQLPQEHWADRYLCYFTQFQVSTTDQNSGPTLIQHALDSHPCLQAIRSLLKKKVGKKIDNKRISIDLRFPQPKFSLGMLVSACVLHGFDLLLPYNRVEAFTCSFQSVVSCLLLRFLKSRSLIQ